MWWWCGEKEGRGRRSKGRSEVKSSRGVVAGPCVCAGGGGVVAGKKGARGQRGKGKGKGRWGERGRQESK